MNTNVEQSESPVLNWGKLVAAALVLGTSGGSAQILLADGSSEATDSRARTSTTVNLRGEFRF